MKIHKMKSEDEYSETVSHNGMDLEILGESFTEPIRKTPDTNFHTQVSVIDMGTGELIYRDGQPIRYSYVNQNNKDGLRELVRIIKQNINIILP